MFAIIHVVIVVTLKHHDCKLWSFICKEFIQKKANQLRVNSGETNKVKAYNSQNRPLPVLTHDLLATVSWETSRASCLKHVDVVDDEALWLSSVALSRTGLGLWGFQRQQQAGLS